MPLAKPLVSVLLPCYNAAETLPEALHSLSIQSLPDFEVVAIDDGSTDATPEILAALAQADPRFRVIWQEHCGLVPALNAGLSACRAGFVARMDGDDRSHPDRLTRQVAFLEQHLDLAVVGSLVRAFPTGQVSPGYRLYLEWSNSLVSDADIRRELFVESPLVHPSAMIRAAWLGQVGGYQEHGWPEDYDLWLRLYRAGARFGKLQEVLYEWREHPRRLTRLDGRYSLENFLRAKAHYLALGPLAGRDGVLIWGAGMHGRRLSKHLLRQEAPVCAFFDIDPQKVGRTMRGLPIRPLGELPAWWARLASPALLVAVAARQARAPVRDHLANLNLVEGRHWWFVA